jgi:methylenetetrahydrofolate reductase (NADPH)
LRIADFYKGEKPVLSLEVFPPKPGHSLKTVFRTLDRLRDVNPSFVSVTYSAQGNSVERTVEIASRVRDEYGCESLAHVTCIGQACSEVSELLNRLEQRGITNILALRGDMPEGRKPLCRDYCFASELVSHITERGGFCTGAAAYPEGHFESPRISTDLGYLKKKVDAGAEFLISQLFFDNRVFYDFIERVESLGITVPVIPGIMPILNYKQIKRILMMCRVSVPAALLNLFDRYSGNPESMARAGVEYATKQVADLVENGVQGIHLYTMNRVKQIRSIVNDSGLRELW